MQHSWKKCLHTGTVLHQTREKSNRRGEERGAGRRDWKVKVMRRQSGEQSRMIEEVEGMAGWGRSRLLTVFCWTYVDVIPSDGQVKLSAERWGTGQPWVCTYRRTLHTQVCETGTLCVFVPVCALVLSIETLVAIWQGSWKGGTKGRFSLSLNGEGRPAEEREMDLLQMPPWAH